MAFEHLIETYGYLALLVGTFLEGETILVVAGYFTHRGLLDLNLVILTAFIGTYLGDQCFFYIGRYKGRAFLVGKPRWQERAEKVSVLLHRHQVPLMIGFRFLYGIRSVTPFVIGASGFSPLRFALLNAIGGIVWAIAVGVLGNLFGQTLELFIQEFKHYELWGAAFLCGVGAIMWFLLRWRRNNLPDTGETS